MKPERWERIKELFGSALEREPAQRGQFLQQACDGDETLWAEVESLLAAHETTESYRPPSDPSPTSQAEPARDGADRMAGRHIGPYQVIREIGRGGMAAVYLAMRADDQYRKRVAIKLVRPGLDGEEMLRRFRNERQTLAALDHPNIVRLLDGGSTEEGLPYLVMDYVEGLPIDEYCDSRSLSVTERLQLFRTVCGAMHYAHQNLVIHRDLKPSNILVTSEGAPKLLDFGIAKLLNPELSSRTLVVTQTNMRVMTPEYASPEQVRGHPVTTATDIYSLGVLLYELLTGRSPYRLRRRTPLEIERAICEVEPEKPSAAVSSIEKTISSDGTTQRCLTPELVSRTREGAPENLRRRLRGDLDNIVLMALRKEPQRRYASVEQFSEDIRRHLESLPVKACRSTLSYRSSKFVRRHKTEVAAAALMTLALIGGTMTAWKAYWLTHLNRRSVAVIGFKNLSGRPDVAWVSTALSEWLTREVAAGEKLRTVPGENVAQFDPTLVGADGYGRNTLTRIRKNLGADLVVVGSYFDAGKAEGGQIRLDLRLQDTVVGETVETLSETGTEAHLLDLVRRAGAQLRERLGVGELSPSQAGEVRASLPSNPEAARLYAEGLAKLRLFDVLAARDLLKNAITADPNYALAHSALAAAWSELGYDENAKDEGRRAFDLSANLSREDHLSIEARYREMTHEWDKAAEVYRALWVMFPDNLDYGLRLAEVQVSAGRGKDAIATIAELRMLPLPSREDPRIDLAQADAAKSLADYKTEQAAATEAVLKGRARGAQLIVARARLLEGGAFGGLGEPKKAIASLGEAQQIYAEADNRMGSAGVLNNLGTELYHQGDLNGAKMKYEEALAIYRDIGAKRGVASSLNNLASVLSDQRELAAARKMREESLSVYNEIGDRRSVAVALGNIANVLYFQGNLSGAIGKYEQLLEAYRAMGTKTDTVTALNNLATLLHEQAELARAKRMYEESAAICRESGNRRSLAYALSGLAAVLLEEGDLATARNTDTEALAIRNEIGEKVNAAVSRIALATVTLEEGRPAEAETMAQQAAAELRGRIDEEASAQVVIARSLLSQRKLPPAQEAISRATALLLKSGGRDTRFNAAIVAACVLAASGKPSEAAKNLEATIAEATRLGYIAHQLEARLALGEIEMKSGKPIGRARLQMLAKQARAKGFRLIARKASAARAGSV